MLLADSSPRAVLACLQTIPFNATLRDNVMDMADAMYSLDIFQYNQLGNSDPLLNQGVDIAAQCESRARPFRLSNGFALKLQSHISARRSTPRTSTSRTTYRASCDL